MQHYDSTQQNYQHKIFTNTYVTNKVFATCASACDFSNHPKFLKPMMVIHITNVHSMTLLQAPNFALIMETNRR